MGIELIVIHKSLIVKTETALNNLRSELWPTHLCDIRLINVCKTYYKPGKYNLHHFGSMVLFVFAGGGKQLADKARVCVFCL